MKKGFKYLIGVIAATLTIGSTVFAEEYTITPTDATWYTNDQTVLCEDADLNTIVVPVCEKNAPVHVIGITSNGFWQVQLEKVYYIPGAGLSEKAGAETVVETTVGTENADASVSTGNYVWTPKTDKWSLDRMAIWGHKDKDRTQDELYINIRNELEEQYQAGMKTLKCQRDCVGENEAKIRLAMRQVMLDMTADYPDINHDYLDVDNFWTEIPTTVHTGQYEWILKGGSGYQFLTMTRK